MRLDAMHAAIGALERLAPEAIAAGGSFARWLPHPSALTAAARERAFALAQDHAVDECVRCLLRRAGLPEGLHVDRRAEGDREWPTGFVGSLAHKGTVVAGVLALRSAVRMIGVDLERVDRSDLRQMKHLIAPEGLPNGVDAQLGTLLAFSAKEAVFKAQFPLSRERLGFSDVHLAWADHLGTGFRAAVDSPAPGLQVRAEFVGDWLISCAISSVKPI